MLSSKILFTKFEQDGSAIEDARLLNPVNALKPEDSGTKETGVTVPEADQIL